MIITKDSSPGFVVETVVKATKKADSKGGNRCHKDYKFHLSPNTQEILTKQHLSTAHPGDIPEQLSDRLPTIYILLPEKNGLKPEPFLVGIN